MVEVTVPGVDFVEVRDGNRLYRLRLVNSLLSNHDAWKREVEGIEKSSLKSLKNDYRVPLFKHVKDIPLKRTFSVPLLRKDGVRQHYHIRRYKDGIMIKGKSPIKDVSVDSLLDRIRFKDIRPIPVPLRKLRILESEHG